MLSWRQIKNVKQKLNEINGKKRFNLKLKIKIPTTVFVLSNIM